jgi:hypothetical protein
VITDEELLAACRAAGEPGTESHRLACRLYRRSVIEWRAGHAEWRAEYADRAGLGLAVALLTEAAEDAGWLIRCGTHRGYQLHIREKTEVCPECRAAERVADRGRDRVRFWAGTWPPPDAAAEREAVQVSPDRGQEAA